MHPGMASEPLEFPEFHDFRNSPPSAVREYVAHCHTERNQQGRGNRLVLRGTANQTTGTVHCNHRLGGPLNYYYRDAASSPTNGKLIFGGCNSAVTGVSAFFDFDNSIYRKKRNRELGSEACQQFSRNSTKSPDVMTVETRV